MEAPQPLEIVPSRDPGEAGTPILADSLRLSEEVFRAIFEGAGIGMALVDPNGRPIATNGALREISGYSEAELRAMTFAEFTHPDDVEADLRLFGELLRGQRDRYQMEKRYLRKEGEIVHARLTVSVVRNTDGSPRYAIGMVEDVSERRRGAEERKRLRARLAAAQEEERRQIAEDLHDDPVQKLTALGLRLSTMARAVEDAEQRERLEALEGSVADIARRLRGLMFDLRPPGLDREGLGATIRQHVVRLADETGWDWEVDHHACPELPPEVRAAGFRILQEALANTRKHAEARRVVVRLRAEGPMVLGEVVDDGVGFEPGTAPDAADGHLGLSSMRERAELFGGACEIESAPGRGTTVRFRLPIADETR